MLATFVFVACHVEQENRYLNGNSYKLNAMLTINILDLLLEDETPQQALSRFMQHMRNLFRDLPHRFSGFWRLEFGTLRYGGWHYHIVFHLPRGMREILLNALPDWTGKKIDALISSQHFRGSKWQVKSEGGSWQLKRVYDVLGIVEYLAKIPIDPDGRPLTRKERLIEAKDRVREYAKFGVK